MADNAITIVGTVTMDPEIRVTGTGIVAYIASGSSGSGYIDPATGVEFTGNSGANGYYEALVVFK